MVPDVRTEGRRWARRTPQRGPRCRSWPTSWQTGPVGPHDGRGTVGDHRFGVEAIVYPPDGGTGDLRLDPDPMPVGGAAPIGGGPGGERMARTEARSPVPRTHRRPTAPPTPPRRARPLLVSTLVLATLVTLFGGASPAAANGLVQGLVSDDAAAPLSGIEVNAYDATFGTFRGTTSTQPDGTYALSLPTGNYRLRYRDLTGTLVDRFSGGATGTVSWVASSPVFVPDPGSAGQNIVMSPPLTSGFTGVVKMITNSGEPDVLVEARTTAGTTVASALTDSSGTYAISGLAAGDYILYFSKPTGPQASSYHPNTNLKSEATVYSLGSSGVVTVNHDLLTGARLRGRAVVGNLNAPGMMVVAVDPTTPEPVALTTVDSFGNYRLRNLLPGPYKVAVVDPLLTSDPAHSLRPIFLPNADLVVLGVAGSHAAGASYTGIGNTETWLPNADLVGAGCDPNLVFPGANLSNRNYSGSDLRGCTLSTIDLSGTTFTGANLAEAEIDDANLQGAIGLTRAQLMSTDHDWDGVDLSGTSVTFDGVDFQAGQYSFINADLSGLDLHGARFTGRYLNGADLRGANLQGAKLDSTRLDAAEFTGTNLQGVDFRQATGQGIDFTGFHFDGVDMSYAAFNSANLTNASFSNSTLFGTTFGGAWAPGLDLTGQNAAWVNFRYANLTGATFTNASLAGGYFENAWVGTATFTNAAINGIHIKATNQLTKAQLVSSKRNWANAFIESTDLGGLDFTALGVTLTGVTFKGSNLTGSNLTGRNLTNAQMQTTNLTGVTLGGANLTNARFTGATGTPTGGATAVYGTTYCPDGVFTSPSTPTCVAHGFAA